MGKSFGGGTRSNAYSTDRFTNWTDHDPHWAEVNTFSQRITAAALVEVPRGKDLRIYERPLSSGFIRPFTVGDVAVVLQDIPARFLVGLNGVYLLGGTARQLRLKAPAYGMYEAGCIYLTPLPKQLMERVWKSPPKPNVAREYTRFGAEFITSGKHAVLTFNEPSLRLFYLYDVLLHELGHHVDAGRPKGERERFARWFSDFQLSKIREEMSGPG